MGNDPSSKVESSCNYMFMYNNPKREKCESSSCKGNTSLIKDYANLHVHYDRKILYIFLFLHMTLLV